MAFQQFDDGSAIWTDDAGNILQVQDSTGVVSQPNRNVADSFLQTLNGAFSRLVNQAFRPAPVTYAPADFPSRAGGYTSAQMQKLFIGAAFAAAGVYALTKLK